MRIKLEKNDWIGVVVVVFITIQKMLYATDWWSAGTIFFWTAIFILPILFGRKKTQNFNWGPVSISALKLKFLTTSFALPTEMFFLHKALILSFLIGPADTIPNKYYYVKYFIEAETAFDKQDYKEAGILYDEYIKGVRYDDKNNLKLQQAINRRTASELLVLFQDESIRTDSF